MSATLNAPLPSTTREPAPRRLTVPRELLLVVGVALAARVLFGLLIGGTYDYDEFVILLLGRDFSRGAVAYRDFMFFHPPGILVLMRLLQPLLGSWWPAARLVSVLADTGTAALVWVIARVLFERRVALAAGLLYAFSPLALISSARVGQDPLMTLFGIAGLALLIKSRSPWAAVGAGVLVGIALWIKYPAAYFLPIYVFAAPRRSPLFVLAGAVTFFALMAPFHDQFPAMYDQTVTFQRTRWIMDTGTRVGTVVIYWLVLSIPALVGLWRTRPPLWLIVGFGLGAVFILPSQVYYHYFVPIVPFAALLGARPITSLIQWRPERVALVAVAVLGIWTAIIDLGGMSPLFVTAARLSSIQPTVNLLRTQTGKNSAILADRFEYAYLANRPALQHYFWNVGVLVNATDLERTAGRSGAIVLSHGASSGYPAGFLAWLDHRYKRIDTPDTTIWLPNHVAT